VSGHDTPAATAVDVQVREVERQHEQDTTIDQDVLAVITDQVVRGTGNSDSGVEAAQLEFPQPLFAAAV
jgi:hypothetical protein